MVEVNAVLVPSYEYCTRAKSSDASDILRQCTGSNFGEPVAGACSRIKNETQKADLVAKNVPIEQPHKEFGIRKCRVSPLCRCQQVRYAVRFNFYFL